MSQDQQSCLRFSLEESIWFKKGQEVEELLSISLDPHITIQEQEQYVLIRGTLDLSGEYLPTTPRDEEGVDEFEASGKFVQIVEKREKGENEFVHRFPVDVTIPKNRIANLGDIDVFVESFDYVVPENACLKLNADLTITGIYGEQQTHTPLEVEYKEEELYAPLHRSAAFADAPLEEEETESHGYYDRDDDESYDQEEVNVSYEDEDDINHDYDLTEVESADGIPESPDDDYQPFSLEGRTPPAEEEDEIPVHIQYDSQSAHEESYFRKENVFELPEHELSESSQEQEVPQPASEQMNMQKQEPVQEVEEEEESSSMEEEPTAKKKKIKGKKYESISLTDFFARKEEERAAMLRVCIVQEGETLDQIAEKYDLTIAQLLRVNHLEANQDVYSGQVLYIPNEEPVFKA
ncbi:stage VI sporulation protein D [Rossellomorea aquimaris]|uniref:Stage VI sporulation protein D n=1 Tax=Rossellomorea aquimaris TaxID=189382 RepID=A0A1J6WFT7_9BACI|nr:stage VI sporulation protein D [Rossellomorea aquimaris]OIU70744.1 stage VI sporulation protein D [Rossellomorea aquimaris]